MDQKILSNLIEDANLIYPDSPILAQVTVTQAILESGFLSGGSTLSNQYFNLFGIKGKGTSGSVWLNTSEYIHGERVTVKAEFAVNASWEDSFAQHKALLEKDRYLQVREAKTVPDAFQALLEAGYATDPHYPELLEEIWSKYVDSRYQTDPEATD